MKFIFSHLLEHSKKIIFSGVHSDHDSEARRKIYLFNIFSHVSILCLVSLGIAAFVQNDLLLGSVDLCVAIILIFLVVYLRYSGNQAFCSYLAAFLANVFFCYLFFSGGVNSTAFMWLYTYPTLAFFLLNLFWGSLSTLLLFLFTSVFLFIDLSSQSITVYSIDFAIRFIPSFLVVFLFSYLLERNRVSSHKTLMEKQYILSQLVEELKNKEVLLQQAQDKLEHRVAARTTELTDINEKFREEIEARKRTEQERKRLEIELLRAQKMEVLGILAGGVAHDLNNVLAGVVSYPDMLLADLPADDPLRKPLETIQKSGKNAAAIVNDLLSLARRGVMIKEIISFNDILEDYFQSPEYKNLSLENPGILVEQQLKKDLQPLEGSAVHLQKVLMNLIINAFEAVEGRGTVSVKTENRKVETPINGYEVIEKGNYTVLRIQDSGAGMSEEVLENIFEPFYTRKQMGRSGTGLGMTIVWGTIKDHNGYLDIESTPGVGTAITVFFPAVLKKVNLQQRELQQKDWIDQGNGKTVLIVDDIPEQRTIGTTILEKLGYKVWSVSSGKEAVDFIQKQPVDLVLMDMLMPPGMDGLDSFKEMEKVAPGQKVVLVSGYSDNDRVRQALQLGIGAYLKKPYTIEQLSQILKKELVK